MGHHFSGANGFAPTNVLAPLGSEGVRDLLSSSQIELVSKYASPLKGRLPDQQPPELIPSNMLQIDNGEIDLLEATARMLISLGHPIKQARALADVAVPLAELNEARVGRKRRPPHLYVRNGWIWMTDGETRTTTGCRRLGKGEEYKNDPGANAKLAELVEKRVRRVLGRVLKKDVSISLMFNSWLIHHKPGPRPRALDKQEYDKVALHLEHLEGFFGKDTVAALGWSSGTQYMEWATAQQIKSQSPDADPSEIRYIARSTARHHVTTLLKVYRWFCAQHQIEFSPIKLPKVRRPSVAYLTLEEIIRLISAARGKIYDVHGRIIGHHDKEARYECVVRFILLYVYGGTRHSNILLLTWFHDLYGGHINPALGIIERQGGLAEITNKRRLTSFLIGSLVDLVPSWYAEDEEKRRKYPGRYTHIIHDHEGLPIANPDAKTPGEVRRRMSELFREVRELAGLRHARPHMLKHSGVTFAAWAGMPLAEIEAAFSTSAFTLTTYYVHLRPFLSVARPYTPSAMKLWALRRLSPKSRSRAHA